MSYDSTTSNFPQTWNRYAYVGGRPLSSLDPLGLTAFPGNCIPVASNDNGRSSSANAEADGEFGPYDPGDGASSGDDGYSGCANAPPCTGYTLDGVDLGCGGLGGAAAESGAALQCPNNVCSGIATDGQTYVQFEPLDGGGAGYYDPSDLTNGIHNIGDAIYNDATYAQESTYLAYQACVSLSAVVTVGTADCTNQGKLKGGHYNYGFIKKGGGADRARAAPRMITDG